MVTLEIIRALDRNAPLIAGHVDGVEPAQLRWKPSPGEWSMLEVLVHLADEEVRDFRARVEITLRGSGEAWPAIDPARWVGEERYNERDPTAELARFLEERAKSVRWLVGLHAPAWDRTYDHPSLGVMRASDLLAAWLAHDFLHLRQLNRLRRQHLEVVLAKGARLGYAGKW